MSVLRFSSRLAKRAEQQTIQAHSRKGCQNLDLQARAPTRTLRHQPHHAAQRPLRQWQSSGAALPHRRTMDQDYWQLASGPRMPRQIHQNRELGFGTALERTMTKCHSQYGVFESLMRNEARSKDQTSLLQLLFDDVVTTALKGPIHYIQDDGRNPFSPTSPRTPVAGLLLQDADQSSNARSPRLSRRTLARTQPHRPWLEDSLILEWARLSARFESLCSAEHALTQADIIVRLLPPESARDTDFAASAYKAAISRGSLRSIWSGTPLKAQTLAVDHMLPWACFHCNDLWNLMPADRVENGRNRTPFRPPTFCMTRATEYSRTGPCSPRSLPPASPVKLK